MMARTRTSGPEPRMPPTLDLVTVVFSRETDLLRRQARSIARFLSPEGLGRIRVIVNDRDEDACVAAVEALRPDYGALADRLEVVHPDALLALRPRGLGPHRVGQWLRYLATRHRPLSPFGRKGGWNGNRGWPVQQALKLAAARLGEGRFVLILDAKNHFIRPVSVASFVSPEGRARTYMNRPGDKQWDWIQPSFRLMGVAPPPRDAPSPPTVTPVCVSRAVLGECLDDLERRVGPVEAFFARARQDETEFMLLYAHVVGRHGSWQAVFDPGLISPATIFLRSDPASIDRVVRQAESGEVEVFSVHGSRVATLEPEFRRRVEAIWAERGLD
jgi:hypothetical protein